jgi:chitodextrinase
LTPVHSRSTWKNNKNSNEKIDRYIYYENNLPIQKNGDEIMNNNKKRISALAIGIMLATLTIATVPTATADIPVTVWGYVYVNDVKTDPDQVSLTFPGNSPLLAEFPGNPGSGAYIINFDAEELIGETGTFDVVVSGITYIANETIYIHGAGSYPINLTVNTSGPPVFSGATPTGTGVSKSTSSLSITIQDPDGDSFNWTIETSPNVGSNSGSGASNGPKFCSITGLAYSTTYNWFVNATDGTGWTNKSYSFKTQSKPSPPGPPGPGPGSTNQNPTADADGPYSGVIDEEITFDGSGSTDDGTITNYTWDFGDGNTGYGETMTHTYSSPDIYTVTLTVTDNEGAKDTDETTALISQPNRPPTGPEADGPTSGTKNTEYTYTAVSVDPDNDTIQYTFDWGDGETTETEFLPNGTASTQIHSWMSAGKYTISVKASDNQTVSGTTQYTVLIDVHLVDDIGYLIDDDADETYDSFHNDTSGQETDVEKQDDGTYLLDDDGDDSWDWIYDIETDTLTEYSAEPTPEPDNSALIVLAIIVILFLIILGYLVKRSDDKKKAQKKAAEKKSQPKKKTTSKKSKK